MPKAKILIIDDDKAWLSILSRFLKQRSYDVSIADSCALGLSLAQRLKPDCILLDYHLNDGNAAEVCSAIRTDEALKITPIIVVSADQNEELNSYASCKADGFILKGCSLIKIQVIIESLLRRIEWEKITLQKSDIRLIGDTQQLLRHSKFFTQLSTEQFNLLLLLMKNSPNPVSEKEIAAFVLPDLPEEGAYDAIKMLVYRLRIKLGPQLGKRITNRKNYGWLYLEPRFRNL